MKIIILGFIIWLVAVCLCIVIGNYSGGVLCLYLSNESISQVTWWTLYNGLHLPFKHPGFASAAWGSVLAAWIVFLPIFIALVILWAYLKPKVRPLYGNARFANNRELEPFHYKGDYN